MQVDNKPDELTDCHKDFIKAVKRILLEKIGRLAQSERQEFLQRGKKIINCIVIYF